MLEAEYVDFLSDELNTREDTLGHPFKNYIELCVMELCGELDLPTSKVGPIIKSVCKWVMHKNVNIKELPSPSTVANMVDRAAVISKLQVTEQVLGSKSWDLHADGTSRDGKQIIGTQLTTDKGATLSTGFQSVAVEVSATLLDNAIS